MLDKTAGTVTVTAGAQEAGQAPNHVSLFFARALGFNDADRNRRRHRPVGPPSAGPTAFPLAFSICQVKTHVDGGLQLLVSHGSKAETSCNYGPSGAAVPGGFGWLKRRLRYLRGHRSTPRIRRRSDPGNSYPGVCDDQLRAWAADITAGKDVTVLLPVFNKVTGTGADAKLQTHFVCGLQGQRLEFQRQQVPRTFHNKPPFVTSALACDGSCTGIIGSFIQLRLPGQRLHPWDAGRLRRRRRQTHAIAPTVATPSTNQFRSSF